jgi:hypothetical protein
MHWYDSNLNLSQGNHKLRLKNVYERENPIIKIR